MGIWALYVLGYAVIKGMREGMKKKALQKSSVTEVLFFYTLVAFVLQIPFAHRVFQLCFLDYIRIFAKSFVIFVAWICSFNAISKMPVSLYSVLDLTRMLFSLVFGVIIFQETLGLRQIFGILFILLGLVLVNLKKKGEKRQVRLLYVGLTLVSCLLNAISGTMDKLYLKTMESGQLQFWYMFFLTCLYLGYLLFTRTKVQWKTVAKNPWIYLLGGVFILGDRLLFMANEIPESRVTVMTVIKQSSVLFSVLIGKLFFKEEKVGYRLACACVVIMGILLAVL